MNAVAHEHSALSIVAVQAQAPAVHQFGLFDFSDSPVCTPGIYPERSSKAVEMLVLESPDQVRARLLFEAESRAQSKMAEAPSSLATNAIIETLAITLRRIRQFSDEQLMSRAQSIEVTA